MFCKLCPPNILQKLSQGRHSKPAQSRTLEVTHNPGQSNQGKKEAQKRPLTGEDGSVVGESMVASPLEGRAAVCIDAVIVEGLAGLF